VEHTATLYAFRLEDEGMKARIRVTFKPLDDEVEVARGVSLLWAAEQAGIHLESDCGGSGRCGKCKVVVSRGVTPPTPLEREYLTPEETRNNVRLACQTRVTGATSVMLLTIPSGKEHILEEGISRAVSLQAHVRKYFLNVSSEDLKSEHPISTILEDFLLAYGVRKPLINLSCLKALPTLLHSNPPGLTALLQNDEVPAFEPGDTTSRNYGLAVDIGTTTVVGYLFDLNRGALLAVDSALNGQSIHGSDVISRIDFAVNAPDGLRQLQDRVTETINLIIERVCRTADISSHDIYSVTLVGNTTMNHLFWGMSPLFLSRFPYNPVTTASLCVPAQETGLTINPAARVFSLPLVSGFIGSDTVGVVLSTGLHRSRTPKMAIDIGTNGEIVLTDGKVMIACSCAAGPAFEGAHIQCGMRGAGGAIDRVDFARDGLQFHVIDGIRPKGICGSGFVDAVAGMLSAGLIGSDGRLLTKEEIPESPFASMLTKGKYNQFVLIGRKPCGSDSDSEVVITQKDIRELQLAKGAMMAGIRLLMEKLGLREQDIKEVYLAGAFGNYVKPESALAIGLLPAFKNAVITQVGNAAGSGAKMALLSVKALKEAVKVAEQIEYIELAKAPHFHQEFLKGMSFPL
jgi:uncharacterized 2Fe-2S/4Fe-4S cluster protein (DUF4445 family)